MRNQQTNRKKRGQVGRQKPRKLRFGWAPPKKDERIFPKMSTGEKASLGVMLGAMGGAAVGKTHHIYTANKLYKKAVMAKEKGDKKTFTEVKQESREFMSPRSEIMHVTKSTVGGATGLTATILGITLLKKASDGLNRLANKEQRLERAQRRKIATEKAKKEREERVAEKKRRRASAKRVSSSSPRAFTPLPVVSTQVVSKKKQKRKTRGVPQAVTPEKQALQVRTTRQAFGISGKSNKQINQMISATLARGARIDLTLVRINRQVKHSIPSGWKQISSMRQQERLSFHAEVCIKEAMQTNTSKTHLVIPYAIIEHRLKISAQMPPALLVLRVLSRKKNIIIQGLPPEMITEVRRVIDFV
ncbi:MAG: hypothetical protein HOE11_00360 [Candidatus Diapherotrites archaeon]|jgi:hypothetical protein|nr:hypothetical protein [Candidatus Diapherotrites archaeon]